MNYLKFLTTGRLFFATVILITAVFSMLVIQKRNVATTKRPLRIGMMSGWPPFMSVDNNGNYVGFDVEVAKLVGKKLGRSIEIVDGGSLATLFLSLETGKIDLIFSGLDITKERLARMDMVPYFGQEISTIYLIFRRTTPLAARRLEDIQGITVCVEANATSEKVIDLFPTLKKKALKSTGDMALDVRTGKSNALLAEPQVARRILRADNTLDGIELPLPPQLTVYGCGIAIKRGNKSLTTSVAKVIKGLRRDGTLAALEKSWNMGEE